VLAREGLTGAGVGGPGVAGASVSGAVVTGAVVFGAFDASTSCIMERCCVLGRFWVSGTCSC